MTTNDDLPANLSAPARRALDNAGLTCLDQLCGYTERELGLLHGMGPKALGHLRAALAESGLAFASS